MRFCEKCGSRMEVTAKGFLCPRCQNFIKTSRMEIKKIEPSNSKPIYVIKSQSKKHAKITQKCPRCGNNQAFHWFSVVSGEHAGVHQDRTIEHFKCAKCSHAWSKNK